MQALQRADNEELNSYLLQLVQALRYEPTYPSFLSDFLISRSVQTLDLANFLHWFLEVEEQDIDKGAMYKQFHSDFLDALKKHSKEGMGWHEELMHEKNLVGHLISLLEDSFKNTNKTVAKIERMRNLTASGGAHAHLIEFETPIRLPVRPERIMFGFDGAQSTMFKSKLAPLLACFKEQGDKYHKVIFKIGDDLRQDQLVVQMINLVSCLLLCFPLLFCPFNFVSL